MSFGNSNNNFGTFAYGEIEVDGVWAEFSPINLTPLSALPVITQGNVQLSPIKLTDLKAYAVIGGGVEVQEEVISQHANSASTLKIVNSLRQSFSKDAVLEQFYNNVWNIDTALDYGLDCWGTIVGVTRYLQVDVTGTYFGFETPDDAWTPFDLGSFYPESTPGTDYYRLENDAFRLVILAKGLANITRATIPGINTVLNLLFGDSGLCYVEVVSDKELNYVFEFALTPLQRSIINYANVIPRPTATTINIVEIP